MSEHQKTDADANSREFRRGVEAGVNSEDTKYWQAGYELGQELSHRESKEPANEVVHPEPRHSTLPQGYFGWSKR